MPDYISAYQNKFKDLRKEIDDVCEEISLVFGLKKKINEPRLLMEPYHDIPFSDIKEKITKAKEIKTKAKELVQYFRPLTQKYNVKDIKKLSLSLSVRDIDYVFPDVKGHLSPFAREYKELEEFITKCDPLVDLLDDITSFDFASESIARHQAVINAVKNVPDDVIVYLPIELKKKINEIDLSLKAKQEFTTLYNRFAALERGLGDPPNYKVLSSSSLLSYKDDYQKIRVDLRNFDTRYRKYISMDKYEEIYDKASKRIREINHHLTGYKVGAFFLGILKLLLPIACWLLLLVPLGFSFYTSINNALILFENKTGVKFLDLLLGIGGGIGDGLFKYISLLLGMGYYWKDFYTGMILPHLYIQLIYTVVLILSLGLRILFNIISYKKKAAKIPLGIINWIAITGLFAMPFIMSFTPAMVLAYKEVGVPEMFTVGFADGFITLTSYVTAVGIFSSYKTMAFVNSPFLLNVIFYAYILLAILFNIVFRKVTKRKVVRVRR